MIPLAELRNLVNGFFIVTCPHPFWVRNTTPGDPDGMNTDVSKAVLDSLKPMFDLAEKKGLWFFSEYQQIWISPGELREAQNNGKFRWGAWNWRLRDPKEHLFDLRAKAERSKMEADELEEYLGASGEEVSP